MKYGCLDRSPLREFLVVQSGWFQDGYTRVPRMIAIPHTMTTECAYQADDKYSDPGCVGCCHKTEKDAHA